MLKSSNSDKVYECQTCGKTFSRRTYLQLHKKIHGEKCYICNICNKAFSQPAGLWIHKKYQSCLKRNSPSQRHTRSGNEQIYEATSDSGKRHECDICNRRFSQKHLLSYHKRTHTGENPYPCTICGKMFRGTTTLKYHERTHTGHKPYKCIFCAKSFTQLGPLRLHCRNEHQSDKIYECEVCMEKFEKFRELSSHKKTHLEMSNQGKSPCGTVSCTVKVERKAPSNQVVRNSSHSLDELKHIKNKADLQTSINSCLVSEVDDKGKGHISSSGSLIRTKKEKRNGSQSSHKSLDSRYETRLKKSIKDCMIASHTEGESSCISVNDKRSASMIGKELETITDIGVSSPEDQMLVRPVKQEYEKASLNGKKYKCNVCRQEFSQAHVLKYHKRTHTGENPHPCAVCNKTFRTPGALTVHQRTHNGKRPYKCIFCSQGFTQRGALQQHCRRIHYSDQIYECDVCKEKFEKHRDLSSHRHAHSDVPCTMAKQTYMYDEVKFAVTFEDEAKPVNEIVNPGAEFVVIPRIKQEKGDSSSYKEDNSEVLVEPSCQDDHEKHSTNPRNSNYEEAGNMDTSFSDECLLMSIKQEKEDCDSYDSGISPDTSPLDANVECDERESDSMFEVSMQPIKLDCEEKVYLSIIGDRPPQTTGNMEISLQEGQNFPTHVVDECSKTINDDDEFSNGSRVTTPDHDYIFSSCRGDPQQNSFFDKKSDTSWQFRDEKNSTFTAQPPDVKHQKWKEDNALNTSNYSLVKNNNCPSSSHYNSRDFQLNSAEMDLIQELSDFSNNRPVHSDVLCNDDKIVHPYMKCDTNVFESQTSNFQEPLRYQEDFAKMNTFPCFQSNTTTISNDDNKIYPVLSQGELKHQCICWSGKTGIAQEDLEQIPKYEYGKALTNGTQFICFECDVLPASSHLV